MDDERDDALDHAVTAANLLDTAAHLCVRSCQLAAQTGELAEWRDHADYTALCLARLTQTRVLARDFMETAATMARRRIGDDDVLTDEEYIEALTLTADYAARVLARLPQAV